MRSKRNDDQKILHLAVAAAASVFVSLLLAQAVDAQSTKGRVFYDTAACASAKIYSDHDCETAYLNAKAEFDEKAPKFSTRSECERYFRRCMIGEISGAGHVSFIPGFRGFVIENGPHRQVFPVTEGGPTEALFRPRAFDRPDATVSEARATEAKVAWKQIVAPPPPQTIVATPLIMNDEKDVAAPSGSPQSYPVPKAMLDDMKEREQRLGAAVKD
jgi:hypothetical protein